MSNTHPAIAELTERRNKLDSAIKLIEGLIASADGSVPIDGAIQSIVDGCAGMNKVIAAPALKPTHITPMERVPTPVQKRTKAKNKKPTRAKKEPTKRGPREGTKQQLATEAAENFLSKKKKPVKLSDLHAGVIASGIDIDIKHFSNILSKAPNLVNERGVGWRLK